MAWLRVPEMQSYYLSFISCMFISLFCGHSRPRWLKYQELSNTVTQTCSSISLPRWKDIWLCSCVSVLALSMQMRVPNQEASSYDWLRKDWTTVSCMKASFSSISCLSFMLNFSVPLNEKQKPSIQKPTFLQRLKFFHSVFCGFKLQRIRKKLFCYGKPGFETKDIKVSKFGG